MSRFCAPLPSVSLRRCFASPREIPRSTDNSSYTRTMAASWMRWVLRHDNTHRQQHTQTIPGRNINHAKLERVLNERYSNNYAVEVPRESPTFRHVTDGPDALQYVPGESSWRADRSGFKKMLLMIWIIAFSFLVVAAQHVCFASSQRNREPSYHAQ